MTDKRIIEILWSGGFDSSFRVTQLSMLPVIVQPYYLADNRPSEKMELNAVEEISKLLKQKPLTQFELLPLKYVQMDERILSKEITDAFNRIKKQLHIGSQYEFLGQFALIHPGIEIGVLVGGHWSKIVNRYGKLILMTDEDLGDYFIVDTEHSSEDFNDLFQYYRFPIAKMTKMELQKKYIDWGYEDIMEHTWFCYTPIGGEPCGKCNPCKGTIDNGLKDRFSKKALRRYWSQKYFSPILKFEARILKIKKRIIKKIKSYYYRMAEK